MRSKKTAEQKKREADRKRALYKERRIKGLCVNSFCDQASPDTAYCFICREQRRQSKERHKDNPRKKHDTRPHVRAKRPLDNFKQGRRITEIPADIKRKAERLAAEEAGIKLPPHITKKDGRVRSGDPNAPGKRSLYARQMLAAAMETNPRREGTWGWRSYNILMNAPEGGISYENYLKAGGRNRDLAWDIARGRVEVTPPSRFRSEQ